MNAIVERRRAAFSFDPSANRILLAECYDIVSE